MRILIVCLFTVFAASAQQWQTLSPFPGPGRDDAVAFSIGENAYLTTGNHDGFTESNHLYKFSRNDLSWSSCSAFAGTPRQYASAFSLQGKGYIVGGITESGVALNEVWCYDPATDNWEQRTDFPGTPHWGASATATANFGFLAGGTDGNSIFSQVWKYIPASDTWEALPSLPNGGSREGILAALPNRLVYAGGFSILPLECQTTTVVFDLTTENWSAGTPVPIQESAYLTGTVLGNKVLLAGGWSCNGSFTASSWLTDGYTWESVSEFPFSGIRGMAACTVDGQAFFFSGLRDNLERSSQCSRFGEMAGLADIILYPNPAGNEVNIRAPLQTKVKILTGTGQVVMETTVSESVSLLQLSLAEGLYIIEYRFNGQQRSEKLVITG